MANEFKLFWENNPETPLNAENLSRYIDYYSEGPFFQKDTSDFVLSDTGDNKLKLKANTKVSLSTKKTSAFFEFNNTLVSHDSFVVPEAASDYTYVKESVYGENSVAIEKSTTNLTVNPSFELGLNNWDIILTNPGSTASSITETTDEFYVGSKSAKIQIDASANRATLRQITNIVDNTENISVSLYYKGEGNLNINIAGNTNTTPDYWSTSQKTWLSTPSPVVVAATDEWKRLEIKNISTAELNATNTEVAIEIYSQNENSIIYVDAIQLEKNNYCSSFTNTSKSDTNLVYNKNLINLEEGFIDLTVNPKIWNSNFNYMISVRTAGPEIDALRLYFDIIQMRLVFEMYNTETSSYLTTHLTFNSSTFNQLINKWIRVTCTWDKNLGIKLYADDRVATNLTPFIPYSSMSSSVTDLQIGNRANNLYLEGLIDYIKFNQFYMPDDIILTNMTRAPQADNNIYKIFEIGNKNLIIDKSHLDNGIALQADKDYYIWICDNRDNTASIYVSLSNTSVYNKDINFCRLIGGFSTNATSDFIINSLWDIKSSEKKVIHTERLLIHGHKSSSNNIEFTTFPFSDTDRAQFNVPTKFTKSIAVNNGANDWLNIDSTGHIEIDDIKIDGNTISTFNDNQLNIIAYSGRDVSINGSSVDINSSTGSIKLDNVFIKNDTISISPSSTSNLNIRNNGSDSNITIAANGGRIELYSSEFLSASNQLRFGDTLSQKISFKDSSEIYSIGTQTESLYLRTEKNISFYRNGSHNDAKWNSGGGQTLAALTFNEAPTTTVDSNSRFYAGKVYNAVWNDIAECWKRYEKADVKYNDVVIQRKDGQGIEKSSKRAQKGTVGIVSNTYGYLLGHDGFDENNLQESEKMPVAIAGRVIVRVQGSVKIGDELVSYRNGFAIKASLFEKIFMRDRIIGIADSDSKDFTCFVRVY